MDLDVSRYMEAVNSVKQISDNKDQALQEVKNLAGGILSEIGIKQLIEPSKKIIKNLLTKKAGMDEDAVDSLLEGDVSTAVKQQAESLLKTTNLNVGAEGAEPESISARSVLDDKDLFNKYAKNDPEFKDVIESNDLSDEDIETARQALKDTLSPEEVNNLPTIDTVSSYDELQPGYRVLADVEGLGRSGRQNILENRQDYNSTELNENEYNNEVSQHSQPSEDVEGTNAEAGGESELSGASEDVAAAATEDAALETTDAALDATAAATAEIPGLDIVTGIAALGAGLATLFTSDKHHSEPQTNPSYQFGV